MTIVPILEQNEYPGRGIVVGRSACGKYAVVAYFIMGRSVNSRNRVFRPTEDGIRTEAHDPALLSDPSLIIYHPVRRLGDRLIVTNGDQTDTIRDYLAAGKGFACVATGEEAHGGSQGNRAQRECLCRQCLCDWIPYGDLCRHRL